MEDVISQAKGDFIRAKERVTRVLATTPDDRLNWSPSPTARTPVQQVAHIAEAIKNIHGFLDGRPFNVKNTAEADKHFREFDRQFTTRDQVLSVFEGNCANYVAWLDGLTPERLGDMVELPFGLGSAPVAVVLTFPPAHTMGHVAQMEYIQTIYGDQDWHM